MVSHSIAKYAVVLLCAVPLAAQARPQTSTLPVPSLGAAWYPEQWPEERWEADLRLMEAAHLHVVRVGEFAWSRLEPREGQYDLDWLDRAINLAGKHGLRVVLGTPTATPPAWLTAHYPETLRVDENNVRAEHGNRQQASWSSTKYRSLSRDIVERLAQRFGHNPNVIGWQIDNEISQTSTDPESQAQFQDWLHRKYGTLAAFNARLTTEYWSEAYTDWSQIPVPKHGGIDSGNPGLLLNWREFITDTWVGYVRNQTEVIRRLSDPRMFLTTNTMGFFPYFDHYAVEKELDLAAWDDYMPGGTIDPVSNGAAHDLTRGFQQGRNFWVMETQPGHVNWSSENPALEKGAVRALAWHDIAHGADVVSFWQWRSALNGQEQYHGTILGSDGTPLPLYKEIQQTGEEFERLGPDMRGTHVASDVALLHSYESRWAIEWQPQSNRFDPVVELQRYYRPLRALTHAIDIVSPDADLSHYRLVVAPALNLITAAEAENLKRYVQGGGHLLLGPRSGMKDEDNSLAVERQPGPLVSLLGGRVEQFYVLKSPIPVTTAAGGVKADIWAELLSTSAADTQVTMRYGKANGWLDGEPAMIQRRVGNGSIGYLGTVLDDGAMDALASSLLREAGVVPSPLHVPPGVEASTRIDGARKIDFVVNLTGDEKTVELPAAMLDLISRTSSATLHLGPYGVAVLREEPRR